MDAIIFESLGLWGSIASIVGVPLALIGIYAGVRTTQRKKTTNTVEHGSRNTLKGGDGETVNKVSHGDDNTLSG